MNAIGVVVTIGVRFALFNVMQAKLSVSFLWHNCVRTPFIFNAFLIEKNAIWNSIVARRRKSTFTVSIPQLVP